MSKTNKQPQFTAYIPQQVLDILREEAHKNRRSVNNQLVICLEECLGIKVASKSSDKGVEGEVTAHDGHTS